MAPVRGRPLGPLGWLLTLLLEVAAGDEGMEPGSERRDGVFVARGQETPVMERKAA